MSHNTSQPKCAKTIVQTMFIRLESKGLKKINIKAEDFFN